jgi:hypothetical protein
MIHRRRVDLFATVTGVLLLCGVLGAMAKPNPLFTFSCAADNDLYSTLLRLGHRIERFDKPIDAVRSAKEGSPVLILARKYPVQPVAISAEVAALARDKNLRLFIEFPESLPGIEVGATEKIVWERGVVASDTFGPALPQHRILAVHDCHFRPMTAKQPILVVARVAGFDTAIFGIPPTAQPILFESSDGRALVAATQLSNFIRARYAPSDDWRVVWRFILRWLDPDNAPHDLHWTPVVRPAFASDEKLPDDFERKSLLAAARWLHNSRLLPDPSRGNEIEAALRANQASIATPPANAPSGDGSLGILEGYASGILHDGSQLQRTPLRADCIAESAMVLALSAGIGPDRQSAAVAQNLLDYVYRVMREGERSDPQHSAYGLIAWGAVSPAWFVGNYGDDNARTLLATILSAAALKEDRWNQAIAKAVVANFRTSGTFGFRGDRVDVPVLGELGWKHFHEAETINYSPHFESYLWACYLWAFQQSGFEPLLARTRTGIRMMMSAYPQGWRWQDNMERARMLLCLAWLVRLEDKPEYRAWLHAVADDLLARQQPNGAIHEWLGSTGGGHYQIPQSNEAYGTGETPLIQKNGDPASDQLYTTGFALLGLHEAFAATGDMKFKRAADKLAEFLCRIQIRSEKISYLDGAWFRAFDDRRWEFWASSADVGWGAWCVEAGWGPMWTAAVLGLRDAGTNFWDFSRSVEVKEEFAAALKELYADYLK